MELHHHRADRLADVTQVTGNGFSNAAITGQASRNEEHFTGKWAAEAAQMRADIISMAHRKPDALIVGQKRVIEALKVKGLKNETAHFGALRGFNKWEHIKRIIVIGRELPRVDALEKVARAFAAGSPDSFISLNGARWPKEDRALRMRDNSLQEIKVMAHPDPWAERVLRQIRDAELLQAIDRTRPMFGQRVEILLLSPVVIDLTVDRVERWIDTKRGGQRALQALEGAGVLPLSGRGSRPPIS